MWKTRTAEDTYPPIGQIINVDGVPVHAAVSGAGPDLILLHGAGGNMRDFTFDLVARLDDHYRVIVLDRPGLGHSGRVPGYGGLFQTDAESPREQARFLAQAARQLGTENPIIVGQSYGGAVALGWALDEDPAALVLISAVSQPWDGGLGPLYTITASALGGAFLVPPLAALTGDRLANQTVNSIFHPQQPPEGYLDYVGTALTLRPDTVRANARQVQQLLSDIQAMQAEYASLDLPVEILHGTADTIVPIDIHSEKLVLQIPDAVLTRLDGIGHMPHHSAPDAVIDAIHRAAARAGLR